MWLGLIIGIFIGIFLTFFIFGLRTSRLWEWREGFIIGLMVGGAAIYGLIQFWGG